MAVAATIAARHQLLQWIASPLFYSDAPAKADVLYVLGGDYAMRGALAAKLLRQGWAPLIVFSRESDEPRFGRNQSDLLVATLQKEGVADWRIVQLRPPGGVNSTGAEMRELKTYALGHPMNRVLVITSSFHGRRARMAALRALRGTGIEARVITTDSRLALPDAWQTNPVGRLQVRMEIVKFVYYFFTFFG